MKKSWWKCPGKDRWLGLKSWLCHLPPVSYFIALCSRALICKRQDLEIRGNSCCREWTVSMYKAKRFYFLLAILCLDYNYYLTAEQGTREGRSLPLSWGLGRSSQRGNPWTRSWRFSSWGADLGATGPQVTALPLCSGVSPLEAERTWGPSNKSLSIQLTTVSAGDNYWRPRHMLFWQLLAKSGNGRERISELNPWWAEWEEIKWAEEKEALHVTLLHPRVMAFSWHVSYVNKPSGALISPILSFALTTPTEPLQRFYEWKHIYHEAGYMEKYCDYFVH